MDAVEKLLALEEIRKVKAKRCRAVDQKDWELYIECHTPDCRSNVAGPGGAVGARAMAEGVAKQLEGRTSIHHVHTPEIDFTSDTTAKGTWAMEDMLWWTVDGQERWLHGYGHYFETYEKRDGRWLISSRELKRIRVDEGLVGQPTPMLSKS
jgi:hypothetical protein